MRHSLKRLARAVSFVALLGMLLGCAEQATSAPAEPDVTRAVADMPKAAPTTAAGYQALWASLDPAQWGGADVSLSVPLEDGRAVWLYGDTLSTTGFVHSTAIVQDGGRLHVSHDGAQLLPDDTDGTIYWIESATAVDADTLHVAAMPMRVGSASVWDFERVDERSRVAAVHVDAAGDVTFEAWVGWAPAAAPYNDLAQGPSGEVGHLVYENRAHPEAVLASGLTLWTVNQNWDVGDFKRTADGSVDLLAYQPIFSER